MAPQPLASQEYTNPIWTGKVADQNCGSQPGNQISCNDYTHDYSEIDTDYYVNCPVYTPQLTGAGLSYFGSASEWVGLGGLTGAYELQQAGIEMTLLVNTSLGVYNNVSGFYEYVGDAGGDGPHTFQIYPACGDHVYSSVYSNNCYNVGDLTNNHWFSTCAGPWASDQSAEAILERNGDTQTIQDVGQPYGTTTTFYGVGVTDLYRSGTQYISMGTAQHDYENALLDHVQVADTGPVQNDPGDPPYDQYTLTIWNPCGGYESCP